MLLKHKKTGGIYKLVSVAVQESTLVPHVVYASQEDGTVWTRPASEFFDGRFEVYFAPKAAPDGGRIQ